MKTYPAAAGGGAPWDNPYEGRPLVTVNRNRAGDYEVTVQPGADVADLAAALAGLPADAVLIEHFGDVDVLLVFRPIPQVPAAVCSGDPSGDGPEARPEAVGIRYASCPVAS